MGKRGRRAHLTLETGTDPSVFQYADIHAMLLGAVSELAEAIRSQHTEQAAASAAQQGHPPSPMEGPASTDDGIRIAGAR